MKVMTCQRCNRKTRIHARFLCRPCYETWRLLRPVIREAAADLEHYWRQHLSNRDLAVCRRDAPVIDEAVTLGSLT